MRDQCVPKWFCFAVATHKQIRELMQVEGLTNDEVKSHLQVSVFSFFFLLVFDHIRTPTTQLKNHMLKPRSLSL